jgi:hypothetical protein
LVVCRSSDLIVLLGYGISFFKDRREIGFSHPSTEVRICLRTSVDADNLTNRVGVCSFLLVKNNCRARR